MHTHYKFAVPKIQILNIMTNSKNYMYTLIRLLLNNPLFQSDKQNFHH